MSGTAQSVHVEAQAGYAARICLLPTASDGTKAPALPAWRPFTQRRPTVEEWQSFRWMTRQGLGMIAGPVSDHREVWDFDCPETYNAFKDAADQCGLGDVVRRIEAGYCEVTPNGGRHWIVQYPSAVEWHDVTLARRPGRDGEPKVKTLIELPTHTILAPSGGGVHPSGKPYVLLSGGFDTIASYTVEERDDLIALARSFDAMPPQEPRPTTSSPTAATGERPGDDFIRRTTWAEVLEPHGWRALYTRGDVTVWRRPGKSRGVSATTNYGGSDLLYVFSSSTEFDAGRGYSRFSVYGILEHGGDFAAAAKALATKGYGAPPTRTTSAPPDARVDDPGAVPPASADGVRLEDFYAYMPAHAYLFAPSRELWPASSVNARLGPVTLVNVDGTPQCNEDGQSKTVKANAWLDQHRAVEQMTWIPGMPMVVPDRLVSDGGWIHRPGCTTFNLYRPPCVEPGDPNKAGMWIDHVRLIYPQDADHLIAWLAHRVQRPHEKVNHAIVLGGSQGIGKDTLLEPVKYAIGPWNFTEVSPAHLLGRFNGFAKSVILRISEARDLGDVDRYSFYDRLKTYTAAPPDVLRVDEKNLREYAVWNVCGVIITTNHRTDGIYLPADDRRHYVAWSDLTKEQFTAEYWTALYGWYHNDGLQHVAAYLAAYDLSSFNPKQPPPKTAAFWDVVDANRAPEDGDLADAIEKLCQPAAVTLADIAGEVPSSLADWLRDRKNARQIPHRLEAAGYVAVRNDAARDGYWAIGGRRQVVYARHNLSLRDRIAAAQELTRG